MKLKTVFSKYRCPLELPGVDALRVDAVDAGVHDGDQQVEQDDDDDDVVEVPHHHDGVARRSGRAFDEFRMARIKERPEERLDGLVELVKLLLGDLGHAEELAHLLEIENDSGTVGRTETNVPARIRKLWVQTLSSLL